MSIPTPPPPSFGSSAGIPTPGAIAPVQSASSGEPKSASVLPVVVAFIATGLSLALAFLANGTVQSITGYLLTPMVVAGCLAWDNLAQRHGMQDVWFSPKPRYALILRVLIAVSFVLAYPHIHELSSLLAERLTAGLR